MHELSIAQSIIEIVEQHLPPHDGSRVTTVRLKVGELSGIVTESLEFCFSAITRGTRLEGALLAIEEIPVTARCHTCETSFRIEHESFLCPSCGSGTVTVVSGRELNVTEVELADFPEPSP